LLESRYSRASKGQLSLEVCDLVRGDLLDYFMEMRNLRKELAAPILDLRSMAASFVNEMGREGVAMTTLYLPGVGPSLGKLIRSVGDKELEGSPRS
jgi:hypothetical protein